MIKKLYKNRFFISVTMITAETSAMTQAENGLTEPRVENPN
jgi:hypothetical protein